MTTPRDGWDRALDAWLRQERERLGGRPSKSEIRAFLRGRLSPEETARVRALLVYYPDLTPLLLAQGRLRLADFFRPELLSRGFTEAQVVDVLHAWRSAVRVAAQRDVVEGDIYDHLFDIAFAEELTRRGYSEADRYWISEAHDRSWVACVTRRLYEPDPPRAVWRYVLRGAVFVPLAVLFFFPSPCEHTYVVGLTAALWGVFVASAWRHIAGGVV